MTRTKAVLSSLTKEAECSAKAEIDGWELAGQRECSLQEALTHPSPVSFKEMTSWRLCWAKDLVEMSPINQNEQDVFALESKGGFLVPQIESRTMQPTKLNFFYSDAHMSCGFCGPQTPCLSRTSFLCRCLSQPYGPLSLLFSLPSPPLSSWTLSSTLWVHRLVYLQATIWYALPSTPLSSTGCEDRRLV